MYIAFIQLRNRANTASISNMIELSSKQRKILEKYAQPLQSVVIVGQNGVTEAVEKMTDSALAAHELIKISFNEFLQKKRTKENTKKRSKKRERSKASENIVRRYGAALLCGRFYYSSPFDLLIILFRRGDIFCFRRGRLNPNLSFQNRRRGKRSNPTAF